MTRILTSLIFSFAVVICSFMNLTAADYFIHDENDLYDAFNGIKNDMQDQSFLLYINASPINYLMTPGALTGNEVHFLTDRGATIDFAGSNYLLEAVNNSSVYFSGMDFKNAYKSGSGGVLFLADSDVDFSGNTYFQNNNADKSGGAFYCAASKAVFNGETTFYFNASLGSGGALYAAASKVSFLSQATFENNSSLGSGGATYYDASDVLFSSDTKFQNNEAVLDGGAVYAINNSTVSFSGTVNFFANTAGQSGGALVSYNSNINFAKDVIFKQNVSGGSGGAFYAAPGSELSFLGKTEIFNNISLNGVGGGFYATGSAKVKFNEALTISGNKAVFGGGFYADNDASVTFSKAELKITNNEATQSGGAFYAAPGSELSFSGSVNFTSNTAGQSGGAFYAASGSELSFLGKTEIFNNISLNGVGGGFYATGSAKVKFNEALTISGNKAVSGGGVYNAGTAISFIGNTTISGNKAATSGGGLYLEKGGSYKFAQAAKFENNSASFGGAIFLDNNSQVYLNDVSFINNSASTLGGAVYLQDAISSAGMTSFNVNTYLYTLFSGNTASGVSNAIHIGNNASVIFYTQSDGRVEMYDGITSGTENSNFTNSGAGSFYALGNAMSFSNFINSGNFHMRNASMVVHSNFQNEQFGVFDMAATAYVNALNFRNEGRLAFDIYDTKTNGHIYAKDINLGGHSSLEANAQNLSDDSFRQKVFYLLNYETLTGKFSSYVMLGINPALDLSSHIDYGTGSDNWIKLVVKGALKETEFKQLSGLFFNQSQAASAFDKLSGTAVGDLDIVMSTIESLPGDSEKKAALLHASGYFLANIIASPAAALDNVEIYDKVKSFSHDDGKKGNGLWIQYSAGKTIFGENNNSASDYEDIRNGIISGFDRYFDDKDTMLGVFLKYRDHDVKQINNTASITGVGGGFYGGLIKESWEIKALLEGSADSYETKRKISFGGLERTANGDFNGFSGGLDIQAALKTITASGFIVKPYAGMDVKMVKYAGFTESGANSLSLEVESGSYFKSFARAGIGIGQEKGKYAWQAGVEGKYLLAGAEPEIDLKFADTDVDFKSRGAQQGKVILGCFAGGSYNVYNDMDFFANINIAAADADNNYHGNIGIRYGFDINKNSMTPSEIEEKAAKEKAKKEAAKVIKQQEAQENKRYKVESKIASDALRKAAAEQKQREKEKKQQLAAEAAQLQQQKLQQEAKIKAEQKAKSSADLSKKHAEEEKRKAAEEAKTAVLVKKQAEEIETVRKNKEAEELKAKRKAEEMIRKEEEKAQKQKIKEETAVQKAAEEAKTAVLVKKQAEEIETVRKNKEAEELKAKRKAEKMIRKEEEKAQKQKIKEETAVQKATEEAKTAVLVKKEAQEIETVRKNKEAEELKAKRKAEEMIRKEEEKAQKQKIKEAAAAQKATEEAKTAVLVKKQAQEIETVRKNKEAEELKAKRKAEEMIRKEEEKAQKQKIKEETAAQKAAEKTQKQRLKQEAEEKAATQKNADEKPTVEKAEKEADEKVVLAGAAGEGEAKIKVEKELKEDINTTSEILPLSNSANETEKTETGETVKLSFVLPQNKLFAGGATFDLTSDGIREVWKTADIMLDYIASHPEDKFKVSVEGYTDSSGGAEINMQYSLRRAAAVANELADSDVNDDIIEPKGFGATSFINKNNTQSGENRRVEIKLIVIH